MISTAEWCLETNLRCQEGFCSCVRRLAASEPTSGDAGNPVVEIRNSPTASALPSTVESCAAIPLWFVPLAFLCGVLFTTCITWICLLPVRREVKNGKKGSLKCSDRKSLHAEFTEEQFRALRRNVDVKTLQVLQDTECFTRQGPMSEIMYGTICKGWQLWQLHSSLDEDDPDQGDDAVREMIQSEGLSFPMTGYFFVQSDEFEEAARRVQELEQPAPLPGQPFFQPGLSFQPDSGYQAVPTQSPYGSSFQFRSY